MVSLFAIKPTDENRNMAGSGRPTYEQGRDFDQDGLNKLVLYFDKCLDGLGDYAER